jgi:hypothetical protein
MTLDTYGHLFPRGDDGAELAAAGNGTAGVRRPEHDRTRAGRRVRVTSRRVTASMSSPITRTRTKLPLQVAAEQNVPLPNRSYVYVIHVDGVLRYIGKGTNGRMYSHMKEVRQRLTRKFKLKNIWPLFQRKLTEAVMKGAVIEEIVLADNLTSKQAYKLEYRHLERMVYAGNREQLWNAIPPSIYTPQEYQAYIQKLTENSTSKDRLTRVIARMQLIRLGKYEDKR